MLTSPHYHRVLCACRRGGLADRPPAEIVPGHAEPAIGRRRAPPSLHPAEAAQPLTDTDSARRLRWQTAKGDTKADAKAERAEMLARLHRGERVERSNRTVGEVAEAWLERGRGKKGPWDATTRERYDRIVRQQVLASTDPTRRPLGETKLRDVTVDRVALWSQGNEQALAPSTAKLALIALNQVPRFAVRRGWTGVNPVMQLEPGEKPRWRVEHVRILGGEPHPDPLSSPREREPFRCPRLRSGKGIG